MADAAKARAQARRQAILSSKTDRLAKLTSSARGEEGAAILHDDPPLPTIDRGLREFVGEESSDMPHASPAFLRPSPSPGPHSRESSPGLFGAPPDVDPSTWNDAQQQQLMRALMGGGGGPGGPFPQFPGVAGSEGAPDPFAAMLASLSGQGGPGGPMAFGAPQMAQPQAPPRPRTLVQKIVPLLHALSTILLLAFFVIYAEPIRYAQRPLLENESAEVSRWRRWAELGWRDSRGGGIQSVPIFYSFLALQLALHSVHYFTRTRLTSEPHWLLALALPYLPPPLPALITTALGYIKLGGMVLDDLAVFVFALGVVVWCSGWSGT